MTKETKNHQNEKAISLGERLHLQKEMLLRCAWVLFFCVRGYFIFLLILVWFGVFLFLFFGLLVSLNLEMVLLFIFCKFQVFGCNHDIPLL